MATFQLFHEFKKFLGDGTIDLDTHTFKAMLSNVAPDVAANTVKTDITDLSTAFGYTAGGQALTGVTWLETGAGLGVWRFTATDFLWTASGGSIGPFRYVVIYDDTAASDQLVGYWDYGTNLTLTDGNTFTADIGASGIFELS